MRERKRERERERKKERERASERARERERETEVAIVQRVNTLPREHREALDVRWTAFVIPLAIRTVALKKKEKRLILCVHMHK